MIASILEFVSQFHYSELFATVPGITIAVVGTISAILIAVFGPFKKFQLPFESAPGLPRGFINFILFIPFILCFVLITPTNAIISLVIALTGIPLAGVFMFAYGRLLTNHRYTRPVRKGFLFWRRVDEAVIVGGDVLTPEARAQAHKPLQELLAMAEYNPDEIWVRTSRTMIQQRIELYYFLFFFCTVVTISAGALAIQALIAKEAPLASAQAIWAKGHSQTAPSH